MSFFGDLFYPDNPRRRETVNALQHDILNTARATALSIQEHNELLNRYEVLHGANVTLLGKPVTGLGLTVIELQHVPRTDGAQSSTSELLDSVQSILGPVPLMGLIDGSTDRSALEEAIGRLMGIRDELTHRLESIDSKKSTLEASILGAVQRFNAILRGLAGVVPNTEPGPFNIQEPMHVGPVIEAQRKLLAAAERCLQIMALFRKKWADDFALDKQPTLEVRNTTYQDLVSYGLLASTEEGERMYQAMRLLERNAS